MKSYRNTPKSRRQFLKAAGTAAVALALGAVLNPVRAADSPLKIGVIGSGRIGSALGGVWVKAGHQVMFSSRTIDNDRKLAASLGPNARAGTPQEAADFGDVLLIAVPYRAMPEVGKELGDRVKGKVVIDPSNPIPNRDGETATWAREKGAGLASAELLPGARIVRAFNAIGYARMAKAHETPGERIGMPMAGDDGKAIEVASRLIREIGYEPVLVGGLAMGKYLMPGTPLAGEHTPDEIRKIAATLK
ncbi:MAG TPA: NADPH-dependent F420 reductase [Burkholderiales bacterium]|nr:NADPH-dependent F420 reductase [Burkholderiales bacterium]